MAMAYMEPKPGKPKWNRKIVGYKRGKSQKENVPY